MFVASEMEIEASGGSSLVEERPSRVCSSCFWRAWRALELLVMES